MLLHYVSKSMPLQMAPHFVTKHFNNFKSCHFTCEFHASQDILIQNVPGYPATEDVYQGPGQK